MGKDTYRQMAERGMRTVIIGSGNVATHLALALSDKCDVVQIFSHGIRNASLLANKISSDCLATNSAEKLIDADTYIVSIKDDAICPFLKKIPDSKKNALWVHTSGSIPQDVFNKSFPQSGVLYPLQTFSKNVDIKMDEVSFFVEGSDKEVSEKIYNLAKMMSQHIYYADSELRKKLHIAAVFACNFTNYMYSLANDLLKKDNIPFSVLIPLIKETTRKVTVTAPDSAQTGPAYRGDTEIIEHHTSMLNSQEKEIYELLSNAIFKRYNK